MENTKSESTLIISHSTGKIYKAIVLGEGVPFQRDFETNGHFSDVRDEYKVSEE